MPPNQKRWMLSKYATTDKGMFVCPIIVCCGLAVVSTLITRSVTGLLSPPTLLKDTIRFPRVALGSAANRPATEVPVTESSDRRKTPPPLTKIRIRPGTKLEPVNVRGIDVPGKRTSGEMICTLGLAVVSTANRLMDCCTPDGSKNWNVPETGCADALKSTN